MPLPTGPGRDQIKSELVNSQYAGANSLNEMSDYIFGAGSYSRDAFGGYGNPNIASFTVDATYANSIDVTVTMNDYGNLTCWFWVRYRKTGTTTWNYNELGSASSGSPSFNISGLESSTEYDIGIGVYNKFNNQDVPSYLDWTNTGTATTEASSWSQNSAHFNDLTPDNAEVLDDGGGNYSVKVYWTPSNVPANATGLYLSYDGASNYYDESSGSWSWADGSVIISGFTSDGMGSVAYADDGTMEYGAWLNFGGVS